MADGREWQWKQSYNQMSHPSPCTQQANEYLCGTHHNERFKWLCYDVGVISWHGLCPLDVLECRVNANKKPKNAILSKAKHFFFIILLGIESYRRLAFPLNVSNGKEMGTWALPGSMASDFVWQGTLFLWAIPLLASRNPLSHNLKERAKFIHHTQLRCVLFKPFFCAQILFHFDSWGKAKYWAIMPVKFQNCVVIGCLLPSEARNMAVPF